MYKFIVTFPQTNESREYLLHPLQTILNLKEKISVDFLHSIGSLILQCDTGYLEDDQVMNSLEIFNIEVVLRDLLNVNIQTKFMYFHYINNYTFKISKKDTIKMLKLKISKLLNFTTEIISLKIKNVILKDSKTFDEYEISDNECILFGLNVYFLEINGISHSKCRVINKFIEEDITVSDLVSQLCIEENINSANIRCEYENKPLSDENIVDVMKQSQQPTLELKFKVKILFIDKNENQCEIYMFANETIGELRNKINQMLLEKLSENEVLLIDNICLDNKNSLKFYGAKDVYEVYCGFLLKIITNEDNNCNQSLFVHTKMKILDIKRKLSTNLLVEYEQINLLLGDIQLEDTRSIDFYGIDEFSEVIMQLGISIIIWAIDEPIEYIVTTDTRVEDIRKYVAFRKRIRNQSTVTLLVDQVELDDSEKVIDFIRNRSDIIINSVYTSIILEIELEDPRLPVISVDAWRTMTIGQLKQSICNNYRSARKESIRLWWTLDSEAEHELVNDDELVEMSNRALISSKDGSLFSGGRLRMVLQDRIALVDETGTLHLVFIWPQDSISSLKRLVFLKMRTIPISDIHLFWNDMPLDDGKSIEFYGLDRNSLLEIRIGRVLEISGDLELDIIIPSSDTVALIKSRLLGRLFEPGLPIDCHLELISKQQNLIDTVYVRELESNVISCRVVGTRPVTVYVCNLTEFNNDRFVMATIKAMSVDTVRSLKTKVLKEYCPDCDDYESVELAFLGNTFPDRARLVSCNIGDRNVLVLKPLLMNSGSPLSNPGTDIIDVTVQQIIFKPNSNDEILSENMSQYHIHTRQSVGQFKQQICEKLAIPADNSVTLSYSNTLMNDNQLFCDLHLEPHAVLVLHTKSKEKYGANQSIIRLRIKQSLLPPSDSSASCSNCDIEIDVRERVEFLRALIDSTGIEGIQCGSFVLVCNEHQIMRNEDQLVQYGLISGSEVVLCHSVLVQQQHSCRGKRDIAGIWRIPIRCTDRVRDLRARVANRLGIDPLLVALHYRDSMLGLETLLVDAHISNDCLVTVVEAANRLM